MELSNVLHMEEGHGKYSYAENSAGQRTLISLANPSKEEAVRRLYKSIQGIRRIGIADLGCSTGPNALLAWQGLVSMLERVRGEHRPHDDDWVPEFQVYLNDLPSNDFNSVFKALQLQQGTFEQELGSRCFVNAVSGFFYTRLFPFQTLHFVHSSFSLHWLSQVPQGVEKSKGLSAASMGEAYYQQFQTDFSMFLRCRSEELVAGGCMVLTTFGRKNDNPDRSLNSFSYLAYMPQVLSQMTSEGLIEEEKMDTFNFPLYAPSITEIENEVKKEGSFAIIQSQTIIKESIEDIYAAVGEEEEDQLKVHQMLPTIMRSARSVSISLIHNHFGDQLSMDQVFERFEATVRNHLALKEPQSATIFVTVSLTKY